VPFNLYDSGAGADKQEQNAGTSVVTGTVINNCDLNGHGKLLVRIPSLDTEVWCSMTAPGGGPDAGIQFVHRVDDNVLVALNRNDVADAYILGGLWSTADRPPVSTPDAPVKRVIKTGLKGGVGHEIEMDDALQSISIVSTTKQKITIDPKKIELSNTGGTLTISLDNESQTITIRGVNVKISGIASVAIDAPKVDITAKTSITVASDAVCTIKGPMAVNIN